MITSRFTDGYQTGDPDAIARRYSKGAALASNLNNIQRNRGLGQQPPPRLPDASYQDGPDESSFFQSPDDSAPDTAPSPSPSAPTADDQTSRNAAAFQDSPDGVRPPAGNATQRWQSGNTMRSISPQRRYFWATGRIDGRATQAPQNALTDFDKTFGPDRAHMGSPGTTWDERQANNDAGVAAAVAQRGLPDSWAPY